MKAIVKKFDWNNSDEKLAKIPELRSAKFSLLEGNLNKGLVSIIVEFDERKIDIKTLRTIFEINFPNSEFSIKWM